MKPIEIGGRVVLWAFNNPVTTAGLGIGLRYAPIPTAKVALEAVKLGINVTPHIVNFGRASAAIITVDAPVIATLSRGGVYAAAAVAGYGIGAVAGTAISTTIWGPEGQDDAIEFYTGRANLIDYVPHVNAFRIVKHYVS